MADISVAWAQTLLPNPVSVAAPSFPEWLPKKGDDRHVRDGAQAPQQRKVLGT
jgi:hypothetical protein